ncbi:unnamed protein product [Mycena citricolor]|uniref:COQ9 C-terminal domain-containing protein n=1 Tax=Mycena citricolor TaxID=2018698 RepID=A0AAD2H5G9_9AGAR|nr:unnamed protein product [Mycena citricolor]
MSISRSHLLKLAIPLVAESGFTRTTLSRSVLHLPSPHSEPLSDSAVSSLFGSGNSAQKTLINAWLENGLDNMKTDNLPPPTLKEALHTRLSYNEAVLAHLPEAFAILCVPESRMALPPLDAVPALKHAAHIADQACFVSGQGLSRESWYAKRASIMGIYTAAELHQLTSPRTAHAFLDDLLESSTKIGQSVSDMKEYAHYIFRSWGGLARSRGW